MNGANTFSEVNIISRPRSPIKKDIPSDQSSLSETDSILPDLFRQLNRMRMAGTLCNCVLTTTDGATFRVHKVVMAMCSDYFRTLFTTSLTDKGCGDSPSIREFYCIPNVTSVALECIINFAYSGIIHIDENNVIDLLPAADQFNVIEIVEECTDFILGKMTAENSIGIWRLGKEYFVTRLENEAKK